MNNLRVIERIKSDGSIEIVRMRDLTTGDKFRMYENGNYVPGTFVATGEPTEDENGVWGIQSEVECYVND